jgi:hypothetical protein
MGQETLNRQQSDTQSWGKLFAEFAQFSHRFTTAWQDQPWPKPSSSVSSIARILNDAAIRRFHYPDPLPSIVRKSSSNPSIGVGEREN